MRLTLCVCAALIVRSAVAADALDPTRALAEFEPPTEAVLYLVPPTLQFFVPPNEPAMQHAACGYVTQDPVAIAALVDVVRRSSVRASPRVEGLNLRAGVYFVAADGATLDLLLNHESPGGVAVSGVLRRSGGGEVRSIDVSVAPALVSDLRAWAKRFGGSRDGVACKSS